MLAGLQNAAMDLLGGGLDSLLGGGMEAPAGGPAAGGDLFGAGGTSTTAGLGEIFGVGAVTASSYVPPQEVKTGARRARAKVGVMHVWLRGMCVSSSCSAAIS